MQSLTQPTLLLKPFAESGDKNSIPSINTDAQNPQLADLTNGFPPITSEDPSDGGLPPARKDLNGLGYLTTTYDFFYQAGGTFTFNSTVSTAIGGYPLNARLWYTDSNGATTVLRSTKNNNTDNFVTTPSYIGTSWVQEIPVLGWDNVWTGYNTFSGGIISSGVNIFTESNTFSGNVFLNGTLSTGPTVKRTIVRLGIPDYSAGETISTNPYTPPKDGIIVAQSAGGYSTCYIKIKDGDFISRNQSGDSAGTTNTVWAIVSSDDQYEFGGSAKFYPFVGA